MRKFQFHVFISDPTKQVGIEPRKETRLWNCRFGFQIPDAFGHKKGQTCIFMSDDSKLGYWYWDNQKYIFTNNLSLAEPVIGHRAKIFMADCFIFQLNDGEFRHMQ